jgi:hypothetical protein
MKNISILLSQEPEVSLRAVSLILAEWVMSHLLFILGTEVFKSEK